MASVVLAAARRKTSTVRGGIADGFNQGYKDLLTGGLWASSDVADRELPEEVGLTRADGWTVAYEQQGSGSEPERTIFNQLLYELWSARV